MRLRNIPRAERVLGNCSKVIAHEETRKGRWKEIFGNDNPIHVEIGMGKGQFLLTLAAKNKDINYIGIERYSSVLLRAVEKMEERCAQGWDAGNLRFICMDAANIADVFAPCEVERIYLNFSDPWPKARHAGRRLTSAQYFARYDKILVSSGRVEFKTDNRTLFDFSLKEIAGSGNWETSAGTYDLHHDEEMCRGNVMTEYEEKFSSAGNSICKLIAVRKA